MVVENIPLKARDGIELTTPTLHFSVYFIFLSFWDHGFHCGTLKLLEGH